MANAIDFKVYLIKKENVQDGIKPEIRRFSVDSDVVNNFMYLREKLQAVFPDIRGKRFTVAWTDSEGDHITISSSEELQIALRETQNSSIRRFNVTLHSDYEDDMPQMHSRNFNTSSNSKSDHKLHVGVTCDGCEKSVCGFRYKCLQCVDYDLCHDCEAKGLHPEHFMIRLSVPVQWRTHGKRLSHHINRCMRKVLASQREVTQAYPCNSSRFDNMHSPPFDQTPSWIDTFTKYLNDWTNLPDECPVMEHEQKDSNSKQNKNCTDESSSASMKKVTNEDKRIEFLKNIVGNVSQFLDPLGIDVNVQMKTAESAGTTDEAESPGCSLKKSDDLQQSNKNESSDEKLPNQFDKIVQKENSSIASNTSLSGSKSSVDQENQSPENWILLDNDSTTPADSSENTSKTQKMNSVTENNTNTSNYPTLYPSLPKVSDNIWHLNPKIQRAVETMMEMGFSNDGGWLTQLLVSKNGDISKVLDVLQPTRM